MPIHREASHWRQTILVLAALCVLTSCTSGGGIAPYQAVWGKLSVNLHSGETQRGIAGRFEVRTTGKTTYLSLSGPMGIGAHRIGWPGATSAALRRIPGVDRLDGRLIDWLRKNAGDVLRGVVLHHSGGGRRISTYTEDGKPKRAYFVRRYLQADYIYDSAGQLKEILLAFEAGTARLVVLGQTLEPSQSATAQL